MSCHYQASWVLSEALSGAARNYCGPGSVLMRRSDVETAAAALGSLRRAHYAQLVQSEQVGAGRPCPGGQTRGQRGPRGLCGSLA
jgi:hypothetical protein